MRVIDDDGKTVDLGSTFDVSGKADRDASNLDGSDIIDWQLALGLAALAYLSSIGTGNIVNNAVTLAKLQDATATARMLGRFTAGTGDYEEGDQATVRTFLGLAALAYKATIATADIDNDAVTFAKMLNITTAGRVIGLKAGSTAPGDPELLAGGDIRTMLGTLDADTLNGDSKATIIASVLSTLRDGVGPAYDTLVEIANQLASDESTAAALATTVAAKNKKGVSFTLLTTSADAVHNHALATTDVICQLKRISDGIVVPTPCQVTDANNVTWLLDAAPTAGQWRSTIIPMA